MGDIGKLERQADWRRHPLGKRTNVTVLGIRLPLSPLEDLYEGAVVIQEVRLGR